MDLYLVRHGESEIPADAMQSDYPLSPLGREQARRLAERFRGTRIDHLITTPFRRTQETAQAIANACAVEILEEPGLGAVDNGELAVTPFSLRQQRWPEFYANPSPLLDFTLFGGESTQAFFERVTEAFVERIWDRFFLEPVKVVVVCHNETINALLMHILGIPFDGWLYFTIDHTSVSWIDVRYNRPRIRCVNDTSHLGDLSRGHRGVYGGSAPREA